MRNNKGFTLIEIMMVLGILALVSASIALPAIKRNMDNAKRDICVENRRVVQHAEQRFQLENYRKSKNLLELIDEGYIQKIPECPSRGVYAWISTDVSDPMAQMVLGCSVHFVDEGAGPPIVVEPPIVEPPVVEPPVVEPPVVEPPVVVPPVVVPPDGGKDKGKDKDKDKGGSKK